MQRSVNYIAGAYRGKTVSEIRRNIEKAREVAERVWAAGQVAICPHLNTAFMDGVAPDEVFLEGDLILLKFCQNMILVPGWENSSGTKNEIEFARSNHIEVYDSIERWEHYLLPLDENNKTISVLDDIHGFESSKREWKPRTYEKSR
jgi:hypothetical protein